ncbi:MAG: carboxypeptidase regulatory-like domain-containing protein [Patescibacteria group bacterium]
MSKRHLIALLLALLIGSVPLLVDEELFQLDEKIQGSQTQLYQSIVGVFDHLEISGITDPITAGQYSNVLVEAIISGGGLHCPYEETVHFTTTDPHAQVVLPGDYTFVRVTDCGSHTFINSVRLITVGEQTVTVTEVGNPGVTASQANITVLPGPVANISLAASALSMTANGSDTSTITATLTDQFGNTVADGTTVTFSIETGTGSLSSGTATTTSGQAQIIYTAGTVSGTVTIKALSGSVSETIDLTLNPGAATHLQVSGVTDPITAGQTSNVEVIALDNFNNVATAYTGTVTFSSDCAGATLPSNYTFLGADSGAKTFASAVSFNTVSVCAVTATDVTHASITGSQTNIDVVAGQQTGTITASGHDGQVGDDITITSSVVKDAYNNLVSGVTVTFSITKPDSTVATLTGITNSSGIATATLPGAQTSSAGTYAVTAAASNMTTGAATTFEITSLVGPPVATHLKVEGITDPIEAGAFSQVIVTALDSNNQVVTNYTGTISFSSDCSNNFLPANYTFTSSDSGIHTFSDSVAFLRAGVCAVTAADVTHPSISGSQIDIDVIAGYQSGTITASGHDGQVGDSITITSSVVTDSFGNRVAGLTVTFNIAKPDGSIVTLTGTTASSGIASATLAGTDTNLGGAYSVTAVADNLTTGTATTFDITVPVVPPPPSPPPPPVPGITHFEVKDILDPITTGQASQVTVVALDVANNVVTDYTGTISFSSDCSNSILPGHYTFTAADSGSHTFLSSVIFYSVGVCSVTALDVDDPTIFGSQTEIDVVAGIQLGTITASGHDGLIGDNITITSTAVTDSYGNKVSGVTVSFYVVKPTGRVITLSGTTNQFGIADATLSEEATDVTGTYSVTAAAPNMISGVATTFEITEKSYEIPPPTITQPAYDGQIFDTPLITIKGIAVPNATISVRIIQDDQIIYDLITESDSKGNWQIDLPEPLKNGQYKVIARAVDERGVTSRWSDEINFVVEVPVPPTAVEKIKEIWSDPELPLIDKTKRTIREIPNFLKELISRINDALPRIVETSGLILLILLLLVGIGLLFNSLLTWLDIPFWLFWLWLWILALIKKEKKNYWGVVYDDQTKRPLGRVLVKITNTLTGEVKKTVTDSEGKYGFNLISGTYGLAARKFGYYFPSAYVKRFPQKGYPHSNIGAVVEVKEKQPFINVPISQINPGIERLNKKLYHTALIVLIVNFILNFLYLTIWPKTSALLILLLQAAIVVGLALHRILKKKYWGIVLDGQTKLPRDRANVIILNHEGQKVKRAINTNEVGFFFFNINEAKYQVHVEDPGYQLFQLCLEVPKDTKKLNSLDIYLQK